MEIARVAPVATPRITYFKRTQAVVVADAMSDPLASLRKEVKAKDVPAPTPIFAFEMAAEGEIVVERIGT